MRNLKNIFTVPEKKRVRVILDTDAACEADDQFAIAHALMTPLFEIKGIIAEQFSAQENDGSVEKSYAEIQKILKLMNIEDVYVCKGAHTALLSEDSIPESEGAELIINSALEDDGRPLFVLCQGALTNMAIALRKCPEIAKRLTCIWIGGGFYPAGGWEFNLFNDVIAANIVFSSECALWQVPMSCYTTMQLGYAELECKVYPCGEIGKYLFEQMIRLGMKADWPAGESWSLGDSPAIALALNPGCGRYAVRNAPNFNEKGEYVDNENNRQIRVYQTVDSRYVLEDFFAKLKLNYGDR